MNIDYKLYLVTDEQTSEEELLPIVEKAVLGGVTAVQLREKHSEGKIFFEKAIKLKQLLAKFDVPLIINDRVDIALAVNAEGIHIGQKDLPLVEVKKIIPNSMIVGVSVQTEEQALVAQKEGADYIGVGTVFPTTTKPDAITMSFATLRKIVQAIHIPAVAIGGISLENVHQLSNVGVSGISVVSAIMKADDPKSAAQMLRNSFK
ncbi:thiamine-phosphate diphosphorylase [Bacillus obstructivus]|nr:thiamine-phosphate diphosphorylase [Bacillus obstructivus]